MSYEFDRLVLKDMQEQDESETTLDSYFNEALDSLMNYDSDSNEYDPDGGMLFPPEVKDYNEYYDD